MGKSWWRGATDAKIALQVKRLVESDLHWLITQIKKRQRNWDNNKYNIYKIDTWLNNNICLRRIVTKNYYQKEKEKKSQWN
jgi:glycerol kinase